MQSKYKIKVTKETILELDSEFEAQQIADMFAERETLSNFIGNRTFVSCDYELVSHV